MDEEMFDSALNLSQQMLDAIQEQQIDVVVELDTNRQYCLEQIESYLKNAQPSPHQIEQLAKINQINQQIIEQVKQQKQELANKVKEIKLGKKLKKMHHNRGWHSNI